MAGEQYLAFYKETERGTAPGGPSYKFLQIIDGWPKFKPSDEPRKEFAGVNTALGDRTVRRKESQYTAAPKFYYRPGAETGTFLRQLLGFAGTRTTVDTSGKTGILYANTAMPYGSGLPLEDEALGLVPNLDEAGTTKSQVYGGFRPASATFEFKGTDDVVVTIEGQGAGGWVGAVDQAAIGGVSLPAIEPFNCSEVRYYLGSGISRTGVAPDFTAIAAGTMKEFKPDSLTLKITTGLTDKVVGNGIKGPSKTTRSAQFSVEVNAECDYEDPSSGFSSADEYKRLFSGPATNSLLIVMTHADLAGAATERYQTIIDVPLMQLNAERAEPDNEGKTPSQKLAYKSLIDPAIGYPIAMITVDRAASY